MDTAVIMPPFDVKKTFGKLRVPVKGTINGVQFRSTLVRMHGKHTMAVNRQWREAMAKKAGDKAKQDFKSNRDDRKIKKTK